MVRSLVTFASTSPSKFYMVSVVVPTLMQRTGPTRLACVSVTIDATLSFDVDANVRCEQGFTCLTPAL